MEPAGNRSFSSLMPFLRDLARFSGAKGAKALVFVFLGVLVEGAGLLLLIPLISVVIDTGPPTGAFRAAAARLFSAFSAQTRLEKLVLLVAIFIVLMILRAIVITVREVTLMQLDAGFIREIRSRLTHRLAAADWHVVAKLRHSRITHLMGSGIQQLSAALNLLFRDSVTILMLLVQIAIAIYLSPALAAFAIAAVFVGVLTLVPMLNRARDFGEMITDANLSLINDVGQFLGALKLAKSQNLQDSFTREFDSTMEGLATVQVFYVRRGTVTRLAVQTFAAIVGAIAVVVGVSVLSISVPVLIALLVIFARISGPATQLHQDFQQFVQSLPAYEKIRELEDELVAAVEQPGDGSVRLPSDSNIEFRDVAFLHDAEGSEGEGAGGLRGLTLSLAPSSVIGITGSSGAGKSTFADLLVGLYPPQSGAIFVGGVGLRGAAVTAWRNAVSYVTQDPFLFHDTVRRNLLWGNAALSDDALWEALELVGVADVIRRSRAGLDTIVGERGSLLSGGERQRVSVARAVLRKPKLLVLDEATNAIDVEGERAVLAGLFGLPSRPTIVIVAHRFETLEACERVIVLENGRCVSDGAPHAVLSGQERLRELGDVPQKAIAE